MHNRNLRVTTPHPKGQGVPTWGYPTDTGGLPTPRGYDSCGQTGGLSFIPKVILLIIIVDFKIGKTFELFQNMFVPLTVVTTRTIQFSLNRRLRHWWLVRATYVVDGRFFGHFFWKVEGSSAHTHESRVAHVHSNALTCSIQSMVEGSLSHTAHVWLTCSSHAQ